ncbi:hypothetical protein QN277_018802 [Acacia crassicarpa]|uniref:Uncharacterized protein n=1 Tax=Acacia crassicarpa TaxID=499986 RepID=A0AAE1JXC9_9FABA|nr:hypothetical protein QN277_018802 [Acacia crassicarpa]
MRFAFSKEVDDLLGKKMLLKMKLNTKNKNHPNSSVSVATYAKATDFIDAFDAAADEVGQPSISHDDGEEIILLRNCTAKDKGASIAEPCVTQSGSLQTIDIDDISLSDDIHVIPSKGKRKVSTKKQAGHALNIATSDPSSPITTPSKPLKSIKKEKN